jgi:hypothetical protein
VRYYIDLTCRKEHSLSRSFWPEPFPSKTPLLLLFTLFYICYSLYPFQVFAKGASLLTAVRLQDAIVYWRKEWGQCPIDPPGSGGGTRAATAGRSSSSAPAVYGDDYGGYGPALDTYGGNWNLPRCYDSGFGTFRTRYR